MKNFIEKHGLLIVCFLFVIGFILKSFNLWDNIIFVYDQGKDAQRIVDIASFRHFKLLGSETEIDGVFNGPLIYYLLAPVYGLFHHDPNFVALFMVLVNVSSVFLLYYFSRLLFNNKTIGVIASFLWVISYEQANYARFISNKSFMEIAVLVFFLGLGLYFLKNRDIGLPLSAVGFSLSVHSNFYLIYLIIFYPLFFMLFKKKNIGIRNILLSIGLIGVFFLPYIVAELKWNFLTLHSLLKFTGDQSALFTITDSLSVYAQAFSGPIYNSFFSFNLFIGFLITIFLIIYSYFSIRNRQVLLFFYLCLFSTLPLYGFRSGILIGEVINAPILPFYTILFALGINSLIDSSKYKLAGISLLILVLLSNSILFVKNNFVPITIFNQQELLLKDEKNAIDYTYQSAQKKPFSICAITAPMFINTLWGYLYNWYGIKNYGYLPYWSGQKQDLTESTLPYDTNHVRNRYLIIEELGRVPLNMRMAMLYLEDNTSKLEETKRFGNITVQKRTLQEEPRTFLDTQKLNPSDMARLKITLKNESRYTCYNSY
jgi:hypothetical protein